MSAEFLTLRQASDYLNRCISVTTLRRAVCRSKAAIARGDVPALRFSQQGQSPILFRREWLDHWFDNRSSAALAPRKRKSRSKPSASLPEWQPDCGLPDWVVHQ
jgi:hypothetical protein